MQAEEAGTVSEQASIIDQRPPRQLAHFQVTKQHRRFCEFADAVRRHRYMGACFGEPGLGKTLSARVYAAADDFDQWQLARYSRDVVLPASVADSRTALYTPYVGITGRRLFAEISYQVHTLSIDIQRLVQPDYDPELDRDLDQPSSHTQLLIIDEADRLKANGLEQVRDFFDRSDIGVILIGMPGFDRQLARYPQLYSRIGFAHQYKPLDAEDVPAVLAHYWHQLGLSPGDAPDAEVVNTIVRVTGGNFRLIERLMTQIGRLQDINNLDHISTDLVDAARQTLVIGTA